MFLLQNLEASSLLYNNSKAIGIIFPSINPARKQWFWVSWREVNLTKHGSSGKNKPSSDLQGIFFCILVQYKDCSDFCRTQRDRLTVPSLRLPRAWRPGRRPRPRHTRPPSCPWLWWAPASSSKTSSACGPSPSCRRPAEPGRCSACLLQTWRVTPTYVRRASPVSSWPCSSSRVSWYNNSSLAVECIK